MDHSMQLNTLMSRCYYAWLGNVHENLVKEVLEEQQRIRLAYRGKGQWQPTKYGYHKTPSMEATTRIIAHTVRQAYLTQGLQRKIIRRIRNGQLWYKLTQKFGMGILALCPTSKDSSIRLSNRTLERMKKGDLSLCIQSVEKEKGDLLRELSVLMTPMLQIAFTQRDTTTVPELVLEGKTEDEILKLASEPDGLRALFQSCNQILP
jgi:hypothetical protein